MNSFWAAGYQEGQASGHGMTITDGSWLGPCHEAVTSMSVGAAVTLTGRACSQVVGLRTSLRGHGRQEAHARLRGPKGPGHKGTSREFQTPAGGSGCRGRLERGDGRGSGGEWGWPGGEGEGHGCLCIEKQRISNLIPR